MDCSRNKINELINYIESLGLTVNLKTAARGHQGFFLKNRIDISKNIPQNKIINILLHEFAHYIHFKIEPEMNSVLKIFCTEEDINDELFKVTCFVDENSRMNTLNKHKAIVKQKILEQEKIIKKYYPKFQRSKIFKEFNRYIRFSKAKYLLKHDKIKYITPFLRKTEYYSVSNIEKDFDLPEAFSAYIRLKSYQRRQTRISAKINKLKKYYSSPTELFARFVEGYYTDKTYISKIAPKAFLAFENARNKGYYLSLNKVLSMALK